MAQTTEPPLHAGPPAEPGLKGNMGVAEIVFSVLAFNAPLSVFVGFITVVIGYGNGIGTPVTFLACGCLMLVFAAGFTAMASHLRNPGAFYAFIGAGLGRPAGLGAALVALVSYVFILIGGYALGGITIASLIRDVLGGPDIQWYVIAFVVVAFVGVLGYFRISLSARVLMVFMIGEVIVIACYNAVVLARGGAEGVHFNSFTWEGVSSGAFGLAVLFGITTFSGFEATAIYREEARDPLKTVPRATYVAIFALMGMYAFTSWTMIIGVGEDAVVAQASVDPTGTAFNTTAVYLGNTGLDILIALLCTSILAANIATHNVSTRYIYSLSRDRIFPAALSHVHKKDSSPHRASVVTTVVTYLAVIACVVFDGNPATLYAVLVGIGGYALIILLILTSASVILYFRARPAIPVSLWRRLIAPTIAMAILLGAFVIATRNVATMIGGDETLADLLIVLYFGLLLGGIAVGFVLRSKRPEIYARLGRRSD